MVAGSRSGPSSVPDTASDAAATWPTNTLVHRAARSTPGHSPRRRSDTPGDQDQRSAPAGRAATKLRPVMRPSWSWRRRPSGLPRQSPWLPQHVFGSRQPSLDLIEDLRVGGIAAQLMIKLAGAVIVAGPGGQQTKAVGQGTQPRPGVSIMILMVYLDAIQLVIASRAPSAHSGGSRCSRPRPQGCAITASPPAWCTRSIPRSTSMV